jgi:hypothetical protein
MQHSFKELMHWNFSKGLFWQCRKLKEKGLESTSLHYSTKIRSWLKKREPVFNSKVVVQTLTVPLTHTCGNKLADRLSL